MKIRPYVTTCPKVYSDDLVSKARAKMRKSDARALPVFEKDKLVGVVTRSDILKITSTKTNIEVRGLLWKPLVTISADSGIRDAIKEILQNKIKQLPVIENGEFIGMIRDVDLLKAVSEESISPNKKMVSDLMSSNAELFSKDDAVSEVWSKIQKHSGFPVIDKNNLVGIITSKELMSSKKARIVKESNKPNTSTKVGTIMRIVSGQEDVFTIKKTDSIQKAAEKIINSGSNILVVKERNKKVDGVLTKKDILKGYL